MSDSALRAFFGRSGSAPTYTPGAKHNGPTTKLTGDGRDTLKSAPLPPTTTTYRPNYTQLAPSLSTGTRSR